ncbi:MAG: NAD(P)-dependent oxidoreductase [Candidatus Lokiarchaeota archaeon]|nr:NAD(P)-dependent oxidoreductase [Candidatus Lokiarchaeota archaeon]
MKILITGGAGYIGSLLNTALLKKGYKVRVLDNLMYGQITLLEHFINKNFEFIKGDIRDQEVVEKALKGVDLIIHLAAIVGAPACQKDKKLAEEINFQGTVNINDSRKESQKIIYASTGSVYGALNEICSEESITNPTSIYGKTKLKAEQYIIQTKNAVCYRFATAFGLSPRLRLDLLLNYFVFQAVKNKYIVLYDKDVKRTFIHVSDIVRSFIFGIERFDEIKNEVYNIGSENLNFTKEEIVMEIRKNLNFELYYADKGLPDPDQRNYEVSYKKIGQKGFETKIFLEEGICELIKGFQILKINNPYSNINE